MIRPRVWIQTSDSYMAEQCTQHVLAFTCTCQSSNLQRFGRDHVPKSEGIPVLINWQPMRSYLQEEREAGAWEQSALSKTRPPHFLHQWCWNPCARQDELHPMCVFAHLAERERPHSKHAEGVRMSLLTTPRWKRDPGKRRKEIPKQEQRKGITVSGRLRPGQTQGLIAVML